MTIQNNACFEEMKNGLHAWNAARREREERKQRLIREAGWDSPELAALNAEAEADKIPYADGAIKAYRAWADSLERGADELEMSDFLWESEVGDFVETLRKAGVPAFAYTSRSTAVMENLHWFAAAGCSLDGLCNILRERRVLWGNEPEKVMGIRIRLN